MKAEKIISLFAKIISCDTKEIDKSVNFLLKNIQQVLDVAQKVELPRADIEKFVKLGKKEAVNQHLDTMDIAEFERCQDFLKNIVGETPAYVEKKSLLNFQNKIDNLTGDLCLLGGDYNSFESFRESLSEINLSKVDKLPAYTLIVEAFAFSPYYWEHHFDLDVSKESMDLYLDKKFIELTQTSMGNDKKLKKSIENNILEAINFVTESTFPFEGEKKGLINRSEHSQIIKMLGKIVVAHDLSIDTEKIKTVEFFKANNSQNLEQAKKPQDYFDGVQKNLDGFINSVEDKKKTTLVL